MTAELAVAIAFVIFAILVIWKGVAKITVSLDKRGAEIRRKLEDAQQLREEAQLLLAQNQRKQRDAQSEAEEIVARARDEAERLKADAAEKIAETIKRREDQAVARIAQAEARALQDVRDEVVDLAIDATSRLITENMTAATQNRLIGEAARDLAGKLQ